MLELARAPYCRRLDQPVAEVVPAEAYRANALFDAHREDPEFGYRCLADEARSVGAGMADRTAWRICRDKLWWSVFGKKLKDVFSKRIVGYSLDARMKSRLAAAALDNAVARRESVAGRIVQRSRLAISIPEIHPGARPPPDGWLDGESRCGRRQRSHGVLLQPASEERSRPPTVGHRQELRIAIVPWIERTYHRRRRQASLGRLTPVEFETVMTTPALHAA
ncbi:hypothetical protein [Streptomyces sp. NPDC092307]|uniref:hypothetical protein n=1 Tax=Streptomyces sp. NPDC092307 TaxID=3366013 RepID=UPI00380411BB